MVALVIDREKITFSDEASVSAKEERPVRKCTVEGKDGTWYYKQYPDGEAFSAHLEAFSGVMYQLLDVPTPDIFLVEKKAADPDDPSKEVGVLTQEVPPGSFADYIKSTKSIPEETGKQIARYATAAYILEEADANPQTNILCDSAGQLNKIDHDLTLVSYEHQSRAMNAGANPVTPVITINTPKEELDQLSDEQFFQAEEAHDHNTAVINNLNAFKIDVAIHLNRLYDAAKLEENPEARKYFLFIQEHLSTGDLPLKHGKITDLDPSQIMQLIDEKKLLKHQVEKRRFLRIFSGEGYAHERPSHWFPITEKTLEALPFLKESHETSKDNQNDRLTPIIDIAAYAFSWITEIDPSNPVWPSLLALSQQKYFQQEKQLSLLRCFVVLSNPVIDSLTREMLIEGTAESIKAILQTRADQMATALIQMPSMHSALKSRKTFNAVISELETFNNILEKDDKRKIDIDNAKHKLEHLYLMYDLEECRKKISKKRRSKKNHKLVELIDKYQRLVFLVQNTEIVEKRSPMKKPATHSTHWGQDRQTAYAQVSVFKHTAYLLFNVFMNIITLSTYAVRHRIRYGRLLSKPKPPMLKLILRAQNFLNQESSFSRRASSASSYKGRRQGLIRRASSARLKPLKG